MHSVEDALDIMNERSRWQNGNWIVRHQLDVVINSFTEGIDILRMLYKSKNTAIELFEIDSLDRRKSALEHRIMQFGDLEAGNLGKEPLHSGKLTPAELLHEIQINVA